MFLDARQVTTFLPPALQRWAFRRRADDDKRELLADCRARGDADGRQRMLRLGSLFVHVPKTGGRSLTRSLYGAGVGHLSIRTWKLALPTETYDRLFRFSIVRNPWDRLWSAYRYVRAGEARRQLDRDMTTLVRSRYPTFGRFVREGLRTSEVLSHVHFRPQVFWLVWRSGLGELDHVGRFEDLQSEHRRVRRELGMEQRPLPHLNRGPARGTSYVDAYDHDMRQIVAATYSDDVRSFGYRFAD